MDTREIKEVYLRTKEALEHTAAENIRLKQQIEQLKVEKAELHEEWFLKNAKNEQLLYEALEAKSQAESDRDLAEELYNENADRLIEALKLDPQVTLGYAVDYALEAISEAKTAEKDALIEALRAVACHDDNCFIDGDHVNGVRIPGHCTCWLANITPPQALREREERMAVIRDALLFTRGMLSCQNDCGCKVCRALAALETREDI